MTRQRISHLRQTRNASVLHPHGYIKAHCNTKNPKNPYVRERELVPSGAASVRNGHCNTPFQGPICRALKTEDLGHNERKNWNAWKNYCEFFRTTMRFLSSCFWATFAEGYFIFPIKLFQESFSAQKCYIYRVYWEPNKFDFSTVTEGDQSRKVNSVWNVFPEYI